MAITKNKKSRNIPGYKICPSCEGTGEHETGRRDSETGYADVANCSTCQSEGIVPDQDKICASCFEAGQVAEMDGYNAGGEPMCYDCLDARDDVQPGD